MPLGIWEDAPHLFKYALLYDSVARRSGYTIGPDQVDQWETWQSAAYLGIGIPHKDDDESLNANRDPREVVAEKQAWFEAVQKAKVEGTDPPPLPPSLRHVQREAPPAGVVDTQPLEEMP